VCGGREDAERLYSGYFGGEVAKRLKKMITKRKARHEMLLTEHGPVLVTSSNTSTPPKTVPGPYFSNLQNEN
jgi:hypothetical protein